jgi:hypothetical protein
VRRRYALRGAIVTVLAAASLPACSSNDWTISAEKAAIWAQNAEADASLFVVLYGVATVPGPGPGGFNLASSDDYAVAATTDVKARLGSCATTTTSDATDTYTFTQCGAARGIAAFDGTVTATYALDDLSGDTIGVTFTARGLRLGDRTRDLALAGGNAFPAKTWSMSPGGRAAFHLAETAPPASNGENRDALLALDGDFTDHGCAAPAGHEQNPAGITAAHGLVSVDDAEAWTIDVSAYHRCAAACPAAGATIQVALGEQVTLAFDGGAAAHATNETTGEKADVPLGCTP